MPIKGFFAAHIWIFFSKWPRQLYSFRITVSFTTAKVVKFTVKFEEENEYKIPLKNDSEDGDKATGKTSC